MFAPVSGAEITPAIRLIRQLGAGGMGSVWLAEHRALSTHVVVKFLAHELAEDATTVNRFAREAAAAASVKSPHVVQMFDHGVIGGIPYIVMELLEGEDLSQRLERGPLSPADVGTILEQTAKALMRAHERGIVHRDIKPENIYLCNVGYGEIFVKLLDFGIAKSTTETISASTRTGAVIGTPYYMSPEQIVGSKSVDYRTDIWALGIVAFECLTGRKPFDADTVGALTLMIHTEALPRPSVHLGWHSPDLDAWFERACAREPAHRFQSARELAEGFRLATSRLTGAYPAALPPSMPDPRVHAFTTTAAVSVQQRSLSQGDAPARGSGRALVGVATAVVLVLVIGFAGGAYLVRSSRAAAAQAAAAQAAAAVPPVSNGVAAPSTSMVAPPPPPPPSLEQPAPPPPPPENAPPPTVASSAVVTPPAAAKTAPSKVTAVAKPRSTATARPRTRPERYDDIR